MNDIELAQRLERLERDNRRLKRFGAAALVLAAALGLMAATRPVPQKITAHEFDVVDGAGRVRIVMKVHEDSFEKGEADITLSDGRGVSRVSITASRLGLGEIGLPGSKGLGGVTIEGPPSQQARDMLSHVVRGFPAGGIYLSGVKSLQDIGKPGIPLMGGPGIALTVSPKGSPKITLADGKGKATTNVDAKGVPVIAMSGNEAGISLLDAKSVERASIMLLPGGPDVTLNGETGNPGLDLNDVADKPVIQLSDPQGFSMDLGSTGLISPRTGATQQTSADSIVMFANDKERHVIWRAPSVLPRLPSATLPAVPPSTPPTPSVPSSSQSASILANHASGAYLKLDDGTSYIVDAVDRVTSALWLVGDDVVVDPNSRSCTDTRLINVDENGDSVCAKPVQ